MTERLITSSLRNDMPIIIIIESVEYFCQSPNHLKQTVLFDTPLPAIVASQNLVAALA